MKPQINEVLARDAKGHPVAPSVSVDATTPVPSDDEYRLIDFIHEVTDEIDVPRVLSDSIYEASGNHFLPIYWITEPLHNVDVTAWADFFFSRVQAVIGPAGLRVGPEAD